MNYKEISENIETEIEKLFEELRSGISAREDSRAFGAMIEKRVTENWGEFCSNYTQNKLVLLNLNPFLLWRKGLFAVVDLKFY